MLALFVQVAQDCLLRLGRCVMLWTSLSKWIQLLRQSETPQGCISCIPADNMMRQDPFRERSILRYHIMNRSRSEQYIELCVAIVGSTKLPNKALSQERSFFFDRIQDDLWLSREDRHLEGTSMKRQFQTQWSFADIDLSFEQRAEFEEWLQDPAVDIFELLPVVLEEGLKMSIVYKPERMAWIATLTGMPDSGENANVSMSSFHESVHEAIGLALFKHLMVAQRGAWAKLAPAKRWG